MVDITISGQERKRHQIPRVPLFMRTEKKSDDYDPKVVSLGPYHHGKEELKYVEEFKPMAVDMFIQGTNKNQELFFEKVLEVIDDARSCYLEKFTSKYSDIEFAQMMLFDACFILNDIEITTQYKTRKQLGTAVYLITRRDLYLLENQVPFRVLKLLAMLKYGDGYDQFEKKVKNYCSQMFFDNEVEQNVLETDPPHLLEVFRRVLVTGDDEDIIKQPCCDIQRYFKFWRKNRHERLKGAMRANVFRSVMDLKSKGIHFRPSEIDSLRGVRFTSHYYYAKLKLPCWNVSSYTKVFFKNMIAYELCPSGPNDRAVVSYINFLKSLIITPQDVKELREEKIIFNTLGSDEEVVQVYKELKTYGAEDLTYFTEVKRNIQEHYHSKAKTWIAELTDTYFNSPWSLIALVVTIFITFLTVVQTYYGSPFYHSP